MEKIIFFEGPDKSGKSTIAEVLARKLNLPYIPSETAQNQGDYYNDLVYGELKLAKFLVQLSDGGQSISFVKDRNWISELIYGTVYGRKVCYETLARLDELYANLNTYVIVCIKNDNKYNLEGEPELVLENHQKLHNKYINWFYETESKYPKLLLNTSDQTLNNQISIIKQFIGL